MQFKPLEHTLFDGYTALASANLLLGIEKQFQCYHQPLQHLMDSLCISGHQQRTVRRKSQSKTLHKQGTYVGIMLHLWDMISNSLPLHIQRKITKHQPLKKQRQLLWPKRRPKKLGLVTKSPKKKQQNAVSFVSERSCYPPSLLLIRFLGGSFLPVSKGQPLPPSASCLS